ncbi:energy transducer TonB [Nitrospira lenta]|uniref:Putative TonB protein n=1 Tax=Nitrospira lenta TaxID=1436998 RepID=A0A330L1V0_9BACT|nr:energy transducer TonB [Nitrospira lenta]SPP63741.1 putative TonB protein [Nitrospira lenta]
MMVAENYEGMPYSAWGVSFAIHGAALCVALVLSAQVQPVLKEETFQWEVALVHPSPDVPQPETAQSTPTVQPSKPTPVRTVQATPPVESSADTVVTRVATSYSPEIVHPTMVPPKPEPVREIVQAKVQPVEPQEIKREEIKKEEVKHQEVVKSEPVVREPHPAPVAREVAPPVESVATAQAYEPPASSRAHHAEAAPVIHRESPSPEEAAPEWRPLTAVGEAPAKTVVAAASVPAEPAPAAAAPVSAAAAPVQAPAHHADAPVVASVAPVRPATKADNAWLAESLGRRIKELTRYPSSARLNGSEGKVVLRVILRADGHLADVTVHRSSGHEVLDRAAMETVRLACPIHMKQALSAAEVAVYVPIVYSLAG